MTTSASETGAARASGVRIVREELVVDLADGRTLAVPIDWFPRLLQGSSKERSNWRLMGSGVGIHWPDLDEDVSVEGLLAGRRSGESRASFERWLSSRTRGPRGATASGKARRPRGTRRRPPA